MTAELKWEDSQVKELLNAVVKNLTNPQPVYQKIGELVVAGIGDNFRVGGAYSSSDNIIGGDKKWEKHSPATLKIKERKGMKGPHQVLIESGILRDSITSKATNESLVVGTTVEYAALQHFGAKKGEFGIVDALIKAHVRNLTREGQSLGKRGKLGKLKKMSLKSSVRGHIRKQSVPFGDVPARPFMTIHPDRREEIIDILANFILPEKQ